MIHDVAIGRRVESDRVVGLELHVEVVGALRFAGQILDVASCAVSLRFTHAMIVLALAIPPDCVVVTHPFTPSSTIECAACSSTGGPLTSKGVVFLK